MFFQPSHSLYRHTINSDSEAHIWLKSIQETPYKDIRATLPLCAYPDPPKPGLKQKAYACGPVQPSAVCPLTGRLLRLHLFRDLSGVILRKSAPQTDAWEALPATISLASEISGKSLKDVPYNERDRSVARIHFQARPNGVHWRFFPPHLNPEYANQVDEAFIHKLISAPLPDLARSILEAPSIADPRVYANPPEGSRFAPFSNWPSLEKFPSELDRLQRAVRSLVALHAHKNGLSHVNLRLQRLSPDTPWRHNNRTPQVILSSDRGDLSRAIRHLMQLPSLNLPAAMRFGEDRSPLHIEAKIKPPASKHQELALHQTLSSLLSKEDIAKVMEKLS